MFRALFLIALAVASSQALVSYDGYKVYKVTPKTVQQRQVLEWLRTSDKLDFWSETRMINHPWTVMVEPASIGIFNNLMIINRFEYKVFIENVDDTINKEIIPESRTGRITFAQYNRFATIQSYLEEVASTHSNVASLFSIGKSSEGRDITGLKISNGGTDNPIILVDAGIHAREWMAPATATYIIQQLVENSAVNGDLFANVDWYIIPSLNPDGYEYTFTNDRMWRKTRSRGSLCRGVDGNRNFGFHWMENGASNNECSDIYAGPRAFSEPETDQLKEFALALGDRVKLYLTFHSYGEMLLYPWGFTSEYPENADELQSLGESVNRAIRSVRGTDFVVGSSTNVLYPAAGGSDDWMKGVAGIPLAYTLELWGQVGGFQPPASQIVPVVQETFAGVRVFGQYIASKYAAL